MTPKMSLNEEAELLLESTTTDWKTYVLQLEGLRARLLRQRVRAYQSLCKAREQYRHPKDKELTDFDRKTMLEAAVADIQAEYEQAHGLEELVAERAHLIGLFIQGAK